MRIVLEGVDAVPVQSRLVLETEDLSFTCELDGSPLGLVHSDECPRVSFEAGIRLEGSLLELTIFTKPAATIDLTITDNEGEVLVSESLMPEHVDEEPPMVGPRYPEECPKDQRAEMTVSVAE